MMGGHGGRPYVFGFGRIACYLLCDRHFVCHAAEDLGAFAEVLVGRGETDSEVRVAIAEDVPRDDDDVVFDRLFAEGVAVSAGRSGEDVEGAGGFRHVEMVLE